MKKLLTYSELIQKMKDTGIQFNIINEQEATKLLQTKNYYFKISSYRKIFDKIGGKYNIEFAVLFDLSIIDMQLRYFLLDLCLDVEHAIKTVFMDTITKNPNIDGYNIVNDYAVYNPTGYKIAIKQLSKNTYLHNLYNKHKNSIPIWVLIEVTSFGNLINLIEMYCNKFPTNITLKNAKNLCGYIRHIRNACAHSNVLLVDTLKQTVSVSNTVLSLANIYSLTRDDLKYRKIHDVFALIYLHNKYCSNERTKQRLQEFYTLIKKENKYLEYYSDHHNVSKIINLFNKTIEILSEK